MQTSLTVKSVMNHNVFQKIVDKMEPPTTLYLLERLCDKKYQNKSFLPRFSFSKVDDKLPNIWLFPSALHTYGIYNNLDILFKELFECMKSEIVRGPFSHNHNLIIYIRITVIPKLGVISDEKAVEYMYLKSKIYVKDAGNYVDIGTISEKTFKNMFEI